MSDVYLLCWVVTVSVGILQVFVLLLCDCISPQLGQESYIIRFCQWTVEMLRVHILFEQDSRISKIDQGDGKILRVVIMSLSVAGILSSILGIFTTLLQIAIYIFMEFPKFLLGGIVL